MLVLTRKIDESICIGDGITIKVIGMVGRSVKLGITAPLKVRILRSELVPLQPASQQSEPAGLDASLSNGGFQVAT